MLTLLKEVRYPDDYRDLTVKDLDNLASQLAKQIWDFLDERGGMSNGYSTYVKGDLDSGRRLKWFTPEYNSMTGWEAVRAANALSFDLRAFVKEQYGSEFFNWFNVEIRTDHIEHGCNTTRVFITPKHAPDVRSFWRPKEQDD